MSRTAPSDYGGDAHGPDQSEAGLWFGTAA